MDERTLGVPKEHCPEHHTLLAFYQSCILLPWVTKIRDFALVRTIGSNLNSPCSVHSQQGRTHLQTPHWVPLHSGGHGTASQRRTDIIHSLHAGQRKTASGQVPKKRALLWLWVFFLFLLLVCKNLCCKCNNFPACIFWPSNVDMRKLTKGRNSGGDLTTKGPIYSVQWGRDSAREGRRTGWEGSWINELKMSWNSGCLNTLGVIKECRNRGVCPGRVDSTGFFNFPLSKDLCLPHGSTSEKKTEEMQTVLIWLHNDPVTVSQNRYCQYQRAGRHQLTAAHSSYRPSLLTIFLHLSLRGFLFILFWGDKMWKQLKDASAAGERTARWRNLLLLLSTRLAVFLKLAYVVTVKLSRTWLSEHTFKSSRR